MVAKATQRLKQIAEDRSCKWMIPVENRGLGESAMTAKGTTPVNLTKNVTRVKLCTQIAKGIMGHKQLWQG